MLAEHIGVENRCQQRCELEPTVVRPHGHGHDPLELREGPEENRGMKSGSEAVLAMSCLGHAPVEPWQVRGAGEGQAL